jgi:hypothetical protein
MVFDRRTDGGDVKEIVEFSCPYGHISHGRDTLETVYERKVAKYQEIAKELRAIRGQQVNVTAIIVSSMGAVYAPSLKALKRILNCSASELHRLGKKMSEAAVLGSMAIWCMIAGNRERGVTYGQGDEVVEEEARNAEQQDLGEDEGGGEEEDEEREDGGNRRRHGEIGQGMEKEGQQMEDDEGGKGRDGDVVSPVTTITVPVAANLFIQPCLDLRFNLMRHWTLMEAMQHSPFVSSRLRLWTHDGNERLQILLAKMGVPLREANTAYIAMSSDLRDSLVRRFDTHCDAQNLTGGHFASFLLKRGYAAHLAASDVVYAVRARFSSTQDFGAAFAETFAVVRMAGNQMLLSDGVEKAKMRTKQVTSLGIELMNRRPSSIVNAGTFRITYIHNAAERGFPVEASALADLAQFLIQAYRANGDPVLPMVVASIDQTTQQWLVVAVSTAFEFGDVEASKFGIWFAQAAERAEIAIGLDSFDSFVCQVPNDLLLAFVDQLTLVASH